MREEAAVLAAVPDYLRLDAVLKATPHTEGDDRFLYVCASDETLDAQNERILCKALEAAATSFLRYGNCDIDHITLRRNVPDYVLWEIGQPVDVGFRDGQTFVKSQLYRGEAATAKNAEMVWASVTAQSPPARWYPSVGGPTAQKSVSYDPVTRRKVGVIGAVNWTNLAFSRTPVNQNVPVAETVPVGVFAKSLGGFVVAKSEAGAEGAGGLTAGYGTDMNGLTGGGALRTQSLDRRLQNYWQFSETLAGDLRRGAVRPASADAIQAYAMKSYGLDEVRAAAWTSSFLAHAAEALELRRTQR
jgi:hypothetical protein